MRGKNVLGAVVLNEGVECTGEGRVVLNEGVGCTGGGDSGIK